MTMTIDATGNNCSYALYSPFLDDAPTNSTLHATVEESGFYEKELYLLLLCSIFLAILRSYFAVSYNITLTRFKQKYATKKKDIESRGAILLIVLKFASICLNSKFRED